MVRQEGGDIRPLQQCVARAMLGSIPGRTQCDTRHEGNQDSRRHHQTHIEISQPTTAKHLTTRGPGTPARRLGMRQATKLSKNRPAPPQKEDTMIYVLHFQRKRHHAQHYLGTTGHLSIRLKSHALGRGARLTRALWKDNQDWTLAALFQKRGKLTRYEIERNAKRRHQTSDYCPFCNPETYIRPPSTCEFPIEALPRFIKTTAKEYRDA